MTDRGRLAHVLLSIDEYQRLIGAGQRIVDLLAGIDFEPQFHRPGRLKSDRLLAGASLPTCRRLCFPYHHTSGYLREAGRLLTTRATPSRSRGPVVAGQRMYQ